MDPVHFNMILPYFWNSFLKLGVVLINYLPSILQSAKCMLNNFVLFPTAARWLGL